jgi:hypothetical protein
MAVGSEGMQRNDAEERLPSIANFGFGTQAAVYFLKASAIPRQI